MLIKKEKYKFEELIFKVTLSIYRAGMGESVPIQTLISMLSLFSVARAGWQLIELEF